MAIMELFRKKAWQWVAALLIIIILWELLSLILASPILPTPRKAFVTFIVLFERIWPHLWASSLRVVGSLIIALILAVPAGIATGRYRSLDALTSPLIYLTYPIPKIALLPVIMGIMGLGEAPRYFLISLIIFFQMLVTIRDAAREVSKQLVYSISSLGGGERDLLWHVFLPAALPKIFTSLRISLATALAVLFLTETFSTFRGLGYFILDASMRGRYDEVFAGIIGLSILGLFLFIIIDTLEKKICPWQGL